MSSYIRARPLLWLIRRFAVRTSDVPGLCPSRPGPPPERCRLAAPATSTRPLPAARRNCDATSSDDSRTLWRKVLLILGWTLSFLTACDRDWQQYSIQPEQSRLATKRSSSHQTSIRMEELFSLGRLDGPEEQVFGMVFDADVGKDGSVYVADVMFRRISVFDSAGRFVRWIGGKKGQGPGELMSPYKIAVLDSLVAVYDDQLGRVNLFGTDGTFRRYFIVPTPFTEDLAAAPDGGLLLTTPFGDSAEVLHYDLSGKLVGTYVRPAYIRTLVRGHYLPRPGLVCAQSGKIAYANAWIYELALLDPRSGRYDWVKRWKNDFIKPVAPDSATVRPAVQSAPLFGFECDEDHIVLAYFDPPNQRLFYDFFDDQGNLEARFKFTRAPGQPFPGFVGGMAADRLVAFRTRPYSQVFIYWIGHQ